MHWSCVRWILRLEGCSTKTICSLVVGGLLVTAGCSGKASDPSVASDPESAASSSQDYVTRKVRSPDDKSVTTLEPANKKPGDTTYAVNVSKRPNGTKMRSIDEVKPDSKEKSIGEVAQPSCHPETNGV